MHKLTIGREMLKMIGKLLWDSGVLTEADVEAVINRKPETNALLKAAGKRWLKGKKWAELSHEGKKEMLMMVLFCSASTPEELFANEAKIQRLFHLATKSARGRSKKHDPITRKVSKTI